MRGKLLPAAGVACVVLLFLLVTPAGAKTGTHTTRAHRNTSSPHGGNTSHGNSASSQTRGNSPSTPDQDGTGMDRGIDNNDKTGPGTDGNNGCGNDPDREDDNNGWCGHKPAPSVTPSATPSVSAVVTPSVSASAVPVASNVNGAQVLGLQLHRTTAQAATTAAVLGRRLARTGIGVSVAAMIGLLLVSAGSSARRFSKR